MISNERPWLNRPRQERQPYQQQRPRVEERLLSTQQVTIERKTFTILLKENPRGAFIRIIEEGRHGNSIIMPLAGVEGFMTALATAVKEGASSLSEKASRP